MREKFERISDEDQVPLEEKLAFKEMHKQIELEKDDTNDLSPEEIEQLMGSLRTERQKEIAKKILIEGKSQTEIGKELGLSRKRIHQIEKSIRWQLSHKLSH